MMAFSCKSVKWNLFQPIPRSPLWAPHRFWLLLSSPSLLYEVRFRLLVCFCTHWAQPRTRALCGSLGSSWRPLEPLPRANVKLTWPVSRPLPYPVGMKYFCMGKKKNQHPTCLLILLCFLHFYFGKTLQYSTELQLQWANDMQSNLNFKSLVCPPVKY